MNAQTIAFLKAGIDPQHSHDTQLAEAYFMGIDNQDHRTHGIPNHLSPEKMVNRARHILAKYGGQCEQARYAPEYLRRKADKEPAKGKITALINPKH